jgi:hypothetical protein
MMVWRRGIGSDVADSWHREMGRTPQELAAARHGRNAAAGSGRELSRGGWASADTSCFRAAVSVLQIYRPIYMTLCRIGHQILGMHQPLLHMP